MDENKTWVGVGATLVCLAILVSVWPSATSFIAFFALVLGLVLGVSDLSGKRLGMPWVVLLAGFAVLLVIGPPVGEKEVQRKEQTYEYASELLAAADYQKAVKLFSTTKGFKDSDEKLAQAQKGFLSETYAQLTVELDKADSMVTEKPADARFNAESVLKRYYGILQSKGDFEQLEVRAKDIIERVDAAEHERREAVLVSASAQLQSGDLEGARKNVMALESSVWDADQEERFLSVKGKLEIEEIHQKALAEIEEATARVADKGFDEALSLATSAVKNLEGIAEESPKAAEPLVQAKELVVLATDGKRKAEEGARAAGRVSYEGKTCVSGADCEEWYVFRDDKEAGVVIRAAKEPVPLGPAYTMSVRDYLVAEALEDEILRYKYEHLEDDPMLKEISRAWGVSVKKLKKVNLYSMLVRTYLKKGKFVDERGPSPLSEEDLRLSPSVLGGKFGRPWLIGSTNLPDGTTLGVTVHHRNPEVYNRHRTVTVRHGHFIAGPFTDGKDELARGEYVVEVTMPLPHVQSVRVQAVIGKSGEHIRGPLMKKDDLGVTAEASIPFFVEASRKAAERADKQKLASKPKDIRRLVRELWALEKKGTKMEPLRATEDLGKLRKCGQQMRENQAKAQELRVAAGKLPRGMGNSFGTSLYAAAINLTLCVSCARDALDYCEMVRRDLKMAER